MKLNNPRANNMNFTVYQHYFKKSRPWKICVSATTH